MKPFHKILLGAAASIVALCLVGAICLHSHAPDFWGYSKLGVSNGTAQSPVFFVEVRGVGRLPTIAYILRCGDRTNAPQNMLEVSHSVDPQFQKRTRVMDHWRSECIVFVGRKVGETIPISLDTATAQKWLGKPGAAIADFTHCQNFWDEFASPRIIEFDKNHPGAGQQ